MKKIPDTSAVENTSVNKPGLSRRNFIKLSAAAAAGVGIPAGHVSAGEKDKLSQNLPIPENPGIDHLVVLIRVWKRGLEICSCISGALPLFEDFTYSPPDDVILSLHPVSIERIRIVKAERIIFKFFIFYMLF